MTSDRRPQSDREKQSLTGADRRPRSGSTHRKLPPYASCLTCGETRRPALRLAFGHVSCACCAEPFGRAGTCSICDRQGSIELHHVVGRRTPGPLLELCLNCHRCETAIRAGQRDIWRDADRADDHQAQGYLNLWTLTTRLPVCSELPSNQLLWVALLLVILALLPGAISSWARGESEGRAVPNAGDWNRLHWPDGPAWRAMQRDSSSGAGND